MIRKLYLVICFFSILIPGLYGRKIFQLVYKASCDGSGYIDNYHLVKKAQIRNCSTVTSDGICEVKQGTLLSLRIKFWNKETVTNCTTMTKDVFSYKYFLRLPLPLDDANVNDKFKRKRKQIAKNECVLQPHKKYTYIDKVQIKSFFPTGSYDVYWELKDLFCVMTRVKVIS